MVDCWQTSTFLLFCSLFDHVLNEIINVVITSVCLQDQSVILILTVLMLLMNQTVKTGTAMKITGSVQITYVYQVGEYVIFGKIVMMVLKNMLSCVIIVMLKLSGHVMMEKNVPAMK